MLPGLGASVQVVPILWMASVWEFSVGDWTERLDSPSLVVRIYSELSDDHKYNV